MILSLCNTLRIIFLFTLLSAAAFSADITGTVINKTTDKPSAGDDVILLKLAQGMQEVARTKTDARGQFKLSTPNDANPGSGEQASGIGFLIRVNHRNVNYHRPAPPGTTSVEIAVYDAAEKLEGISQSVDIMRMEADATNLRVIEMFAVTNGSKPPRTLMSPKSFELVLPQGAQIDQALAAGPGGMPINTSPTPTGEKNHYAFLFPLRPGETRFQVSYSLPYSGKVSIQPVLVRPTENFAVSAPKTMQITPGEGSKLAPKGEDAGMTVFVAQNARPGEALEFTVSGTGSAPMDNPRNEGEAAGEGAANKPGGGMGVPTNTPDPLYKYRWWLMGMVAVVLVAGAAFTLSRPAVPELSSVPQSNPGEVMLHPLKEELFRLESERLENKISPEEYAKTKAALDLLLRRMINRKTV